MTIIGGPNVDGSVAPEVRLHPEDIIPDVRLDLLATPGEDADQFDHRKIARLVAQLLVGPESTASERHTNVALFGPWGSGKSSVFGLLKEEIRELSPGTVVIRYDAWRSTGENFQTHFLSSLTDAVPGAKTSGKQDLYRSRKTVAFDPIDALKRNKMALVWSVLVAVGAALVLSLITTGFARLGADTTENFWQDYVMQLQNWIPRALAAWVAVAVAIKLTDIAKVTIDEGAPSRSEQFGDIFGRLVSRVKKPPLVVFVDELDRCGPAQVLSVLSGLRTFLEVDGCVFVVAVDRDAIIEALDSDLEQSMPVRPEAPHYSTAGAYLDKIFQHQISLPPKRHATLRSFARRLVIGRGGLWGDIRASDPDQFERVIYTLVPAHVRSPRRIKAILNTFATNVRLLEGRLNDWRERAESIAMLSVLQTEFPWLVDDLVAEPRLIHYIMSGDAPTRNESRELVAKYVRGNTPLMDADLASVAADETAGDAILDGEPGDGTTPSQGSARAGQVKGTARRPDAARLARQKLNEQLLRYLTRTLSSNVQAPTPDLLYRDGSVADAGLSSAHLVNAVEYAGDESPSVTAGAFAGAEDAERAVAVGLLANRSNEESSPIAAASLIRAACLIAAPLPPSTLKGLSAEVAALIYAQVRQGVVDLGTIRSVYTIAALAHHGALLAVCMDSLRASPPADVASQVPDIPSVMGLLDEPAGRALAAWVVGLVGRDSGAGLVHFEPLLHLLRTGDDTAVRALGSVPSKSLVQLFMPPEPVMETPAAPRTAAAQQEATAQAEEMQASWGTLRARLAEQYSELLKAVEADDRPPPLLTWVIELGIEASYNPEIDAVIEASFDRVRHRLGSQDNNRLVLRNLAMGAPDTQTWLDYLDASTPLPGLDVDRLLEKLIGECLALAPDAGETQPTGEACSLIAAHIVPLLLPTPNAVEPDPLPKTRAAIERSFAKKYSPGTVDEDMLSLRRTRSRLALLVLGSPAAASVATDIAESAALVSEPSLLGEVLDWIEESSDETVEWLDQHLSSTGPLVDDSIGTTGARVVARRRATQSRRPAARLALPLQVLESRDFGEFLPRVFQDWLSTGPSWLDARAAEVLLGVDIPEAAFRAWTESSDPEDRLAAWHTYSAAHPPVLRRMTMAANHGLPDQVYPQLAHDIVHGGNGGERKLAIRKMSTLPPSAERRGHVLEVIEALGKIERGVDLPLVAELVGLLDGGPTREEVAALRRVVASWVNRSPKSISFRQHQEWVQLGLLDAGKPKLRARLRGRG